MLTGKIGGASEKGIFKGNFALGCSFYCFEWPLQFLVLKEPSVGHEDTKAGKTMC